MCLLRYVVVGLLLGFSNVAIACGIPDIGPDTFCGKYRPGPKTSFYTIQGQLATFEKFDGVKELIQTLPKDEAMRNQYNWGTTEPPVIRVVEERLNVDVASAYIVAIRQEDDRDYHVIISDQPTTSDQPTSAGALFMNVEFSGLPRDDVDNPEFKDARDEIEPIWQSPSDCVVDSSYKKVCPPVKVTVKGSIFFDGAHDALNPHCANCPGPSWAKPHTAWEIHPVFKIKNLQ